MDCRDLDTARAGLLCIGSDFRGIGVNADGIYIEENGQTELVSSKRPTKVFLRITLDVTTNQHRFAYSLDGRRYTPVGEPFMMSKGFWKGFRIGLFCYGEGGTARFDDFSYQIHR